MSILANKIEKVLFLNFKYNKKDSNIWNKKLKSKKYYLNLYKYKNRKIIAKYSHFK